MEKTVKEETFREKSDRLTEEFKKRKYLTKSMKDGSPIKTDHGAIHNHKIAALIFLVVDNGEEFPEIVRQCEIVADSIYDRVDEVKQSTYIQSLQNQIENKVTKNVYLQLFLLCVSLIQGGANSQIALVLIEMINKVVEKNRERYNHINVDSKLKRLHRVVKRNYKPMK